MRAKEMTRAREFLIIAMLAALGTACGNGSGPVAPGPPTGAPAGTAAAPSREAEDATRGMVGGVAAGRAADAIVDLKFELKSRPEVGKPLTVDIALLPKVATDVMNITYLATEGLTVQPTTMPSKYERVQPGSVYRHQATVIPKDNGVFSLSAIVMVQMDTGDVTRTFSIPIVIGAPPDDEARSAAP
ncbi:MAG TPA: hypothetical protein VLB75_05815 [Steroidobacteraceae bacterium]|nr:hypothetical protein [Steroidobacteraceae bacterium]